MGSLVRMNHIFIYHTEIKSTLFSSTEVHVNFSMVAYYLSDTYVEFSELYVVMSTCHLHVLVSLKIIFSIPQN